MAPYISQWELIQRNAQGKGIPIEELDQFRGFFSVGAAQVYPRASKEAQQYLAELWTWNKFFRSGDIFPGRDPLYDDLVAVLNSVEPVAAGANSTSNLNAADNPETGASIKQVNPGAETILMKAQLDRQQIEITSLKESIRGKDSTIREKDKALKARDTALAGRDKALKEKEKLLKEKENLLAEQQKNNQRLVQGNQKKDLALSARNENIKRLGGWNTDLMAEITHLRQLQANLELAERGEGARQIKNEPEDQIA